MAQTVRKPSTIVDHVGAGDAEMGQEEGAPRTPLGEKLLEIRRRIVASGQPLLDWDGVEREVAERRGGAPAIER